MFFVKKKIVSATPYDPLADSSNDSNNNNNSKNNDSSSSSSSSSSESENEMKIVNDDSTSSSEEGETTYDEQKQNEMITDHRFSLLYFDGFCLDRWPIEDLSADLPADVDESNLLFNFQFQLLNFVVGSVFIFAIV